MDEGKAEAEEVCLTGFPFVEASFPCVFLSLSPLSLPSLVSASSCCVPCIVSALTFFVFYSHHHHHHPTFAYPTFHHSTFVYVVLSIVIVHSATNAISDSRSFSEHWSNLRPSTSQHLCR